MTSWLYCDEALVVEYEIAILLVHQHLFWYEVVSISSFHTRPSCLCPGVAIKLRPT